MDSLINKYLEDINNSIEEINLFFTNKEKRFENFKNDIILRKAIMMNIAIIGEAMNKILKINPEINITSSRKIVNTRNYIIHGYDSLQDDILWGIVIRHIPKLHEEVLKLLNRPC